MRPTVAVFIASIMALIFAAGVAFAATVNCAGGVCKGTAADDEITGTHGHDKIYGRGGNDFVLARPGKDTIIGGAGNDRLYGGEQDDRIHAGPGDDYARGKEDNDKMNGGPGKEDFHGGTGSDRIRTGVVRTPSGEVKPDGVRDYVNCGPGHDVIYYEKGVDEVENCEVKRSL